MKSQINLFTHEEQTKIDKIAYFALHYLRYVLVITQFIAILVFFYRFKVDQEIVDLKDTLTQKKSIVDDTSELLKTVKNLDQKFTYVKKIIDSQDLISEQTNYVISQITDDLNVTSIEVSKEGVSLNATAGNIEVVRGLYESLKSDKKYKEVTLSNVNKTDSGFKFSIQLALYEKSSGS